jgi:hypothetical protein
MLDHNRHVATNPKPVCGEESSKMWFKKCTDSTHHFFKDSHTVTPI